VSTDEFELEAIIFGGIINTIIITNVGSNYLVGDNLIFEGSDGTGAIAIISEVSSGNIRSLSILNGGAGFRVNDFLFFSGGGGSGANAHVANVDTTGVIH